MRSIALKIFFCFLLLPVIAYSNELLDAINQNSFEETKHAVLDLKLDINHIENGITPLINAVFINNIEIVKFLISQNADVNKRISYNGRTALSMAIEENHYEIFELLVKHGADVNLKYRMPVKMECVNNDSAIRCYKTSGEKVPCGKCSSKSGRIYNDITLLMVAAANGYNQFVDLLLTSNANIDAFDSEGLTALHHALIEFNVDTALILVNHNANVNLQSKKEKVTSFMLACLLGNEKLVKKMIENNANIELVDYKGRNALFYAKMNKKSKIYNYLINK